MAAGSSKVTRRVLMAVVLVAAFGVGALAARQTGPPRDPTVAAADPATPATSPPATSPPSPAPPTTVPPIQRQSDGSVPPNPQSD